MTGTVLISSKQEVLCMLLAGAGVPSDRCLDFSECLLIHEQVSNL